MAEAIGELHMSPLEPPSGHVSHYNNAISIASAKESITEPESDDHDVNPIINASDEINFLLESDLQNQLGLLENLSYWADIDKGIFWVLSNLFKLRNT